MTADGYPPARFCAGQLVKVAGPTGIGTIRHLGEVGRIDASYRLLITGVVCHSVVFPDGSEALYDEPNLEPP